MMAQKPKIQYVGQFYVHGSEARALQLEEERKKTKARRPLARLQQVELIYVDPVATLAIAVAVCMLVLMAVGIAQFGAARQEAVTMERYVTRLSAENEALISEYQAGYDLEAVEKTALALGLVPKDQVEQITIQLELPEQQVQITLWDRIGTFLAGLFA